MKVPRRPWQSGLLLMLGALVATTTLGSGCFSGNIGEPGTSCQSTRTYFLNEVWGPVMARTCVNCHAPGGAAQLQSARFRLLPATYPDFVEANLASIAEVSSITYTGNGRQLSLLLAKPLGMMAHGGGTVFQEGSPEYTAIAGLIQRMNGGATDNACPDYGSTAAPSGVQLMDWGATLRRASLDLVGRLPTASETAAGSLNEAAFETVVNGMMHEEAFYERFRTAFNDMLLTDRYVSRDGCDQRALNLLDNGDFPNRGTYGGGATAGLDCCNMDRDNPMCAGIRATFLRANNAIAREPINLFDHVIRNDRPFSEILTADYVLVNPASAHVYGVEDQVQFSSYDADELAEARIHYTRRIDMTHTEPTVDFPHAGLLTTAAFLNRYPTTTTNRNRHRARMVQAYFLATDILKVGERPIDPTASEALVMTPTMNYGPCVTCHRINDPIAGAFRGFGSHNDGQARYDAHDAWFPDMFPPGIAGVNTPGENYRNALQWLAPRITTDPRFASSAVRFVYHALTGQEPLLYPTETADPMYPSRSAAWIEQDRVFRVIAQQFVANNMNFRTIVMEMIKSPLYRAISAPPTMDAARFANHTGIGASRLLTPEILTRRITAIAGFSWLRDQSRMDSGELLRNDYYFPYGGIDSDTITRRTTDPSGVIVNVATRMANEVACRGTAFDFTRPREARRFFTRVDVATVPESAGQPVPNSIASIRQNIVDLHALILGERLEPSDPEVDRTYTLFLETWREVTMGGSNALPDACRGNRDPSTGTALPMANQINDDRNGSVRAWMAVLSYLFQDYRFIYQ